jgi:hypothetical protein
VRQRLAPIPVRGLFYEAVAPGKTYRQAGRGIRILLVVVCRSGPRRILDLVAKNIPKVTFDLKPLKSGTDWYLVATYPDGQQEHITGFKIEADAIEWLDSSRCQAWLKARGYAK